MGGGIATTDRGIAAAADDPLLFNQHGTHRHFAAFLGFGGQQQCFFHKVNGVFFHGFGQSLIANSKFVAESQQILEFSI
ncbi:MAG: hypothetical protein WCL37_00170 [Chrysiogenales bacterium]